MHILEKFSLNCGINPLKLEKAEIFSSYYPLPFEKYIVFHACKDIPSKSYSYFQDVVDFMLENSAKKGYGLVQIGDPNDKILNGCLNLNGKINIFQTSFILKNASLLVGNDSFSTHICSAYKVPLVSLYSSAQPEVTGPYWKNQNQLTVMAPLNGNKPSYSKEDPERLIDNIKPEEVIQKIKLILPDIFKYKNIIPKSLFFGKNYRNHTIDIVPDVNQKINIPDGQVINIRFDLLKNAITEENISSAYLNTKNKKFFVTIDKPLDVFRFINEQNGPNLLSIILNINFKNFSIKNELKNLAQQIKKRGAPITVNYHPENLSDYQIGELKLEFLDTIPIVEVSIDKEQQALFLEALNKSNSLTFLKSSSIIISSNKFFLSEELYKQNKNADKAIQKISDIKNKKALAKECHNFYLFNL